VMDRGFSYYKLLIGPSKAEKYTLLSFLLKKFQVTSFSVRMVGAFGVIGKDNIALLQGQERPSGFLYLFEDP